MRWEEEMGGGGGRGGGRRRRWRRRRRRWEEEEEGGGGWRRREGGRRGGGGGRRRRRWEEEKEEVGGGGGEIRKNTYDSLYFNTFSKCLPVTFVGFTLTEARTMIVIWKISTTLSSTTTLFPKRPLLRQWPFNTRFLWWYRALVEAVNRNGLENYSCLPWYNLHLSTLYGVLDSGNLFTTPFGDSYQGSNLGKGSLTTWTAPSISVSVKETYWSLTIWWLRLNATRESPTSLPNISHHRNISIVYLTQNLFPQGNTCRDIASNTQYLVLFNNPIDRQQVAILSRRIYPSSSAIFMKRFQVATSCPYGYLVVDLKSGTTEQDRLHTDIFETTNKHKLEPEDEGDDISSSANSDDGDEESMDFSNNRSFLGPPGKWRKEELKEERLRRDIWNRRFQDPLSQANTEQFKSKVNNYLEQRHTLDPALHRAANDDLPSLRKKTQIRVRPISNRFFFFSYKRIPRSDKF